MSIGAPVIVGAVFVGVGATLAMDLWNLLVKRGLGIASLNYLPARPLASPHAPRHVQA